MSLVEGHAEFVMDGVGPDVVPSVVTLRKRFAQRRKGRGPLDRVMRRLLGLEQKMQQYADGRTFVGGVVDVVGMEGFNGVWARPENLPLHRGADRAGAVGGAGARPPGHPRLTCTWADLLGRSPSSGTRCEAGCGSPRSRCSSPAAEERTR